MVDNEAKESNKKLEKKNKVLETTLKETQERLQEMEETLEAIVNGAVDGLVRHTPKGNQIFILKGSEEPYRNLIEEMTEGAILLSDAGTILYCNIGFAKLADTSLDKIIGKNMVDWVSEASAENYAELMSNVKKGIGKRVFDIAFQSSKKKLIPTQVSITKTPIGSINASALIITDLTKHMEEEVKRYTANLECEISERKKVEEALKRQAALIDLSPDAIIVKAFEGTINFWSKGAEKLYGYTKKEADGQFAHELLKTKFPTTLNEIKAQVRSTGSWSGELCHETKAGQEVIVQSQWLIEEESAEKISILESNIDITQRKMTERKLDQYAKNLEALISERTQKLESTALYARSLIEASLDPLVTINAAGKITDVNKATEDATGCSRGELIGSDFSNYFTEPEKAQSGYQQVFTKGSVINYPLSLKNKSGKVMEVLYNATLYKNSKGEVLGVFAAARDVTERKELERKLQDSERLAAIGQVAGMVGHDIRNPLQAITSDIYLVKSDLAQQDCEEKENIKESLDGIEKNVDYINKIVQDLQDYARTLKPATKEINLQCLCEEVLFKNEVPENVRVSCRVEDAVKVVISDADLVKRILSNLATNAVQAMPEGGNLTIHAYKDKRTTDVIIDVEDTGCGIPEAIKPNLFTPMFSTKSKGQGFGLAVVKRITESMGGTISFESEVDKGTTFRVRLPPQS